MQIRVIDHIIFAGRESYSMIRASQRGDGLGEDFSYVMRSSIVTGTRGNLRAQADGEWICFSPDGIGDRP